MFKYCLWYLLRESHPINELIKRNAAMLNTKVFPAHITIEHSIGNRDEAKQKLDFCKKGPIPVFGYGGTPYASTFKIRNEYATMTHQFYAIEQPLWIPRGAAETTASRDAIAHGSGTIGRYRF